MIATNATTRIATTKTNMSVFSMPAYRPLTGRLSVAAILTSAAISWPFKPSSTTRRAKARRLG
jgi:hypothetical protein